MQVPRSDSFRRREVTLATTILIKTYRQPSLFVLTIDLWLFCRGPFVFVVRLRRRIYYGENSGPKQCESTSRGQQSDGQRSTTITIWIFKREPMEVRFRFYFSTVKVIAVSRSRSRTAFPIPGDNPIFVQ